MPQLTAYDKFVQQALKYGFSLFGLPPTGQTVKYRTGDDGDYEKGYPRQGVRFIDNGDGTITDNATGLMWVKDPSQIGGVWGTPGTPSKMNWNDAIDNSNALNYAGHSDWRLPNLTALFSIINRGRTFPTLDPTFFPNTKWDVLYWSSTRPTVPIDVRGAIQFNFGFYSGEAPAELFYARPVRLGWPV